MKKKEWDGAFVDLQSNSTIPDHSVLKILEETSSQEVVCSHMTILFVHKLGHTLKDQRHGTATYVTACSTLPKIIVKVTPGWWTVACPACVEVDHGFV